jgi:hypothetical protein
VHLGSASWKNATLKQQAEWLKQNEALWSKVEK